MPTKVLQEGDLFEKGSLSSPERSGPAVSRDRTLRRMKYVKASRSFGIHSVRSGPS